MLQNGFKRAYIGLGANLENPRLQLERALAALRALPQTAGLQTRLCACSRFYKTAPVDSSGPDYLNAVAALDTQLAPLELLRLLQTIETQAGRERPYVNAPRVLDLDLLHYEGVTMHTPLLSLPHPRMHERAFVLVPLAELAPELQLGPLGTVSALLATLEPQAIELDP